MNETPGTTGKPYQRTEVYKNAFGHIRPPYPNLVRESGTFGISPVGTIKALKGVFNMKSKLNAEYTMPIMIDGWQLPQEPVLSIRGGKNIVETPLNRGRRKQNVLEEINLNNYQIRIRGIILNEEDFEEYPEKDIRQLREIIEKPGAVSIESYLTNLWNINQIEIRDWDFREVQGYIGAQAFELDCLSDEIFSLELNDQPEQI